MDEVENPPSNSIGFILEDIDMMGEKFEMVLESGAELVARSGGG